MPTTSTTTTPPTATPSPTPSPTPLPLANLQFTEVRASGISPSQVEIIFSLRDEEGHSLVVPAQQVKVSTRIFELGPGIQGQEEIDYAETDFFVHTAENFDLEVVFVLDFTNSMASGLLPDGRTGVGAMLDAFEDALTSLPEAHRVGVVEFHDRSVEPSVLSDLTTDRVAILDAVLAFASSPFDSGSSRVWDSVQTAATLFTSRLDNPTVVRTLVFLSDGRDTSSASMRSDAGDTAIQNDIQLYALGVGDVYEEAQLADTVRSTGGAYYQTEDLSGLQEQLVNLVSDLRGQYRLSYTTLRREGSYVTRVQVDLPWATGSFETVPLDVGSFYGLDTQGRIAIDPPSVIKSKAQADVFVRAIRVPRNISRFRVRADTAKPVTVELVPREDGGLLEGWDLFGPDIRGFYQAFSDTPLEFGESGLLFHFTVSSVTEQRLDIPFIVDNAIYTGGKSFAYPASIFIGQRIDPTGHIAFRTTRDGASEIYVMNFDGSNQQNISNTKYTEFVASWSPDGAQLAFDSDRTFRREIYVMDGDGSKVVQLTSGTTTNELPAWSPDGRLIAFDSSEERDGDREIYVMNVDGSDRRRLTPNPPKDTDGRREDSGRGWVRELQGRWPGVLG